MYAVPHMTAQPGGRFSAARVSSNGEQQQRAATVSSNSEQQRFINALEIFQLAITKGPCAEETCCLHPMSLTC